MQKYFVMVIIDVSNVLFVSKFSLNIKYKASYLGGNTLNTSHTPKFCPICGKGNLGENSYPVTIFLTDDNSTKIQGKIYKCNDCGNEFIN